MLRRIHVSICKEGWYYLVVLGVIVGGAILRDINLLIILAGMMIGPIILSWRMVALTLRKTNVSRNLPECVTAGDLLVVDVDAGNPRRGLNVWAMIVHDRIRRVSGRRRELVESPNVFFPRIKPRGEARANYRGRIYRRGKYLFGPLKISTRFPLGLIRGTFYLSNNQELLVFPRLGLLSPSWLNLVQLDRSGSQRSSHQQGLLEGDFYGLRNYRSGDSRRWIHWRTTAKRNQLSVRQFEKQRNQNLAIMLDLGRGKRDQELGELVEQAISFVATVIADHCRRGSSRLWLGVAGEKTHLIHGASSKVMQREMMELLAQTEMSRKDTMPSLINDALGKVPIDTRVVAVAPRAFDFSDTQRFQTVWDNPQKRSRLSKVLCVEAGSEEFKQYFRLDPLVAEPLSSEMAAA